MTAHHGVPDEADALQVAKRCLQALHLGDEPLAAPAKLSQVTLTACRIMIALYRARPSAADQIGVFMGA